MRATVRPTFCAVAALFAGSLGAAQATTLSYDFSFTGPGISGEGVLTTSGTTDPAAPFGDGYDILGIDGTVNGDPILAVVGSTGLPVLSADGFFIYDNVYYPANVNSPADAYFDIDGLLFKTAVDEYNLYYDGDYIDYAYDGNGTVVSFVDSPVVVNGPVLNSSVPEPGTLVLFGAALIAALMVTRKLV